MIVGRLFRRVLPVVLLLQLPAVAAPAHAATGAVVSAPATVRPGERIRVGASAPGCAGATITLRERYGTSHATAMWRTVGHKSATADGAVSFTTVVPVDAAKTSVAFPLYWVASSTGSAACTAALSTIAGHSTIGTAATATVEVTGRPGHLRLTMAGCRGGIADAYVVDTELRPTPVLGLRTTGSGALSSALHVPASAAALYVDCVQASVPSYSAHGVTLPGSKAIRSVNRNGASTRMSESDAARWASAGCVSGGGFYRWPLICGTTSPVLSTIRALQDSPVVRTQEQRLLGSNLMTPTLSALADLVIEHPTQPGLSPLEREQANSNNTTSTSSHTSTTDGTTVTNTYDYDNGATAAGFGATANSTSTLHGDAAKKKGFLSLTMTVTTSQKVAYQACPDVDGTLVMAYEVTTKVTWSGVAKNGQKVQGSFTEHAAVNITPEVNDSADYTGFELNAAAEVVARNAAPPLGTVEDHSSFDHHYPMTKPEDIVSQILGPLTTGSLSVILAFWQSFNTYGPGIVNGLNSATVYLGQSLVLAAYSAEGGAAAAYQHFNNNGGCLHLEIPDKTSVGLGATKSFTVTLSDVAGGKVSVKVTAAPFPLGNHGTLDPDHFNLSDSAPARITLTAPTDPATTFDRWTFTGSSKRGRLAGDERFDLVSDIGSVTLAGTATVSDSDTCTTHVNGGCDALTVVPFATTDHYTRRYSSTLQLSAQLPHVGTLDTPQQGTGTANESDVTETGAGSWTDSDFQVSCNGDEQCQCTDSGSWSEQQTDITASGQLGVHELRAERGGDGRITDLIVSLAAQTDDQTDGGFIVTSATGDPPSPQCSTGSYNATFAAGYGGTDFQLGVGDEITGWAINPRWDPKTGGTLATRTLSGSADLAELNGDDSGPVSVNATFTITTTPAAG
jgi:hypothetical protein